MTKEEAIKYLRQIYPNGGHCWLDSQRIEAIEMAIMALSKSSLPSNLDEVAREYLREYNESEFGNGGDDWDDDILITFKAGAEWMAEQGETHELTVESPVLGPPMICCPVHADNGDKVVVQIRKK